MISLQHCLLIAALIKVEYQAVVTAVVQSRLPEESGGNETTFDRNRGQKEGDEETNARWSSRKEVQCMDIMHDACTDIDSFASFLSSSSCKTSGNFGPFISKCIDPGNYLFGRAMLLHGNAGSKINAACLGTIVDTDAPGDTVITSQEFSKECKFNNKKYTNFQIHYTHAETTATDGSLVNAGDSFAFLKPADCDECVDKVYTLVLKVLIGGHEVNPIALFRNKSQRFSVSPKGELNGDIRFTVKTPCDDTSANRYEMHCGDNRFFTLDLNRRFGFPEEHITELSHKRDFTAPYVDPAEKPFIDGSWMTDVVIPKVWHEDNCCTISIKDVWNVFKEEDLNVCPKTSTGRIRGSI